MKDDKHRSASIWLANMLVYLSVDIICFLKFVFPQASLSAGSSEEMKSAGQYSNILWRKLEVNV